MFCAVGRKTKQYNAFNFVFSIELEKWDKYFRLLFCWRFFWLLLPSVQQKEDRAKEDFSPQSESLPPTSSSPHLYFNVCESPSSLFLPFPSLTSVVSVSPISPRNSTSSHKTRFFTLVHPFFAFGETKSLGRATFFLLVSPPHILPNG